MLLLPLPGGCCTGRRSPRSPSTPHASRQLVPPQPRGLSPPQKPPPCPARCLLSLAPLPAPLLCHQEQFSGRERARCPPPRRGAGLLRSREMVQFYCTGANRTEDGTILVFLALPCSAVGALGGFFLLVRFFFFSLCCVSSQPGQVFPLPLGLPAASLPSRGPGSTLFKPRVFCLWVCILVALSDFCFIISSDRLWCQKH